MKIGIITIHCAYNYGAVFQAFALKEYLKSVLPETDTVNVVDYRPPFFEDKKGIHFSKNMISNLIELERVAMGGMRKRRDSSFEAFISENDALTSECTTNAGVSELLADYDVVIAGSDQVWNFCITGGDLTYLLDIPGFKGKKLSYSSSLGSFRFYEKDVAKVKEIFNTYSSIACREEDGSAYIRELTGRECTTSCDPTLLLDEKTYSRLYENKVRDKIRKAAQEKFLLIYNLSSDEKIFESSKKIANEKGLKVYQIFPSLRKNSVVNKLFNDISPEEFLFLYSKAEFIVTNSFHGTCFSIINKKNFYIIKPTGSANRLETLLSSIGIPERLILKDSDFERINTLDIDYAPVYEKLEEYSSQSKKYLADALLKE